MPNKQGTARADLFEAARSRIESKGWSWDEAVKTLPVSKATRARVKNYTAGVDTIEKLYKLADQIEALPEGITMMSNGGADRTGREPLDAEQLAAWTEVGERLLDLLRPQPARFQEIMQGLIDLIKSIELQQSALDKLRGPGSI